MDCGNYNPKEDTKEVFNRIVCESIMTMFHLDNWKKSKQMSLYLNENATKDEFEVFENELNRLYEITDQDTVGKLFNSKNSFIWFAAFHTFTQFGIEDIKFIDFLEEFQKTLHSKTFVEYENKSFDTYDDGKGTKDKKVVKAKLNMLEQLMKEYLHITEETNSETENNNTDESDTKSCESDSTLKFIQNNVSKDVSNEDIEEYQDFMDSYVNIDSELYKQCSMALMALTAYAYECDRDVELGKWIENCQSRKWQNLSPSQEVNFKYMKRSFDNFVNANGGAA